jgi:hypothetical protein
MSLKLINDGYTFAGRVEPIGPFPAVEVKYRPALADRVQQYIDASNRGGKERSDASVKLLTEHLVSWDVLDDKGEPAAIVDVNLRRVPYPIREKLVDMVCGYAGKASADDEKN